MFDRWPSDQQNAFVPMVINHSLEICKISMQYTVGYVKMHGYSHGFYDPGFKKVNFLLKLAFYLLKSSK